MKLAEAHQRLQKLECRKFSTLFSQEDLQTITRNKGRTGQLLELALGLHNSNTNLDFEDGELKSNKCDETGKPLETVCITQISSHIDELIEEKPFEQTHLYEKIKNILYVPVNKSGDPGEWMFLPSIHIDLRLPQYVGLFQIWQEDYYSICEKLRHHIETNPDGCIHTSSGKYIQVRSKDSQPYHPIYSKHYGRNISNKNYAFYFRTEFIKKLNSK